MIGSKQKKIVAFLFALVMALQIPAVPMQVTAAQAAATVDGVQQVIASADKSYHAYLTQHTAVGFCGETISVPVTQTAAGEKISVQEKFEDSERSVLLTAEEGYATWKVTVPKTALYAMELAYYPLKGTGGIIQRAVRIDGQTPFAEADTIKFSRIYKDAAPLEHLDGQNDIWPEQQEVFSWQTTMVRDAKGYFGEQLLFYLESGEHTITFESLAEPMAIGGLTLVSQAEDTPDYATMLKEYEKKGLQPVSGALEGGIQLFQAEDSLEKSDQSLHADADVSSPANQPYSYRYQKINVIGGELWQTPGQWISWQIDVPKSGLYEIGFRVRQNYSRDIAAQRSLYIDGCLPFREAGELTFAYNDKWTVSKAGGDTPYLFYLEKGSHVLTMKVSCSVMADSLMQAQESLEQLNQANWVLLTVIGNTPDLNRDYNIDQYCPEVIEIFKAQAEKLSRVADAWMQMTGRRDSNVAQIETILYILNQMVEEPDEIPALYATFKDNISNFANMLANAAMSSLAMDYLFVAEQGAELPQADVGFFTSLKYGFLKFLVSFVTDYNNLSNLDASVATADPVKVWIGNGLSGGRDQAVQLNNLITQSFSPDTGIPINLQLVANATILTATLSGFGPDVALQVAGTDAVQYAMRNAVVDLSKLDGFDEVKARFNPETFVGVTYEGGTYMLPETMSFPVMFYRKDILERLSVDIHSIRTWDDLISVMAVLQRQNMNVGMAKTLYYTFLFQMGGKVYKEGGKASDLDSKTALNAFYQYMDFYTKYDFPYTYNFVTRFRTGEVPIAIEEYTSYNTLRLAAPEIDGQWGMTTIPGTRGQDGSVNSTALVAVSGCVLMSTGKNQEAGWKFMKWYTDADTQYEFGSRLEGVMGVGARYNTANLEAFERLPWQPWEKRALFKQMQTLTGLEQVPGGYMSGRSVSFAMNTTYNTNGDARKVLLSYVDRINQEIEIKRAEFGLDAK
ncbi:MAG: extracellular solute-binding protein [Clostridia bacterium]|nr:extracellular solute-binding protein [Clostridia bacterium]